MANWDARLGNLRLCDLISYQLQKLDELREILPLMMGAASYCYRGLLTIRLCSHRVPICKRGTFQHY